MPHKTVSIIVFAFITTLILSGCGRVISGNAVSNSESMDAAETGIEVTEAPAAQITLKPGEDLLEKIHSEICKEMEAPRSLIFGVGIGWAEIDGKITGFGTSKRESRVVVEVNSTVYDSYVEKWSKLYGDMVYVESVNVIMDEISSYTDQINQNTLISMKMEYDSYPYGTEKANILISNNTDSELGFGDIEIYEKLVDGAWHTIYQDYFSGDVLYIVKGNSTLSYEIIMPLYIMDLEAGTYRIIKKLGDEYFSAEFSVE